MNKASGIFGATIDRLNALGLIRMASKLDELYSSSSFLTKDRMDIIYEVVSEEYDHTASAKLQRRLKACKVLGSPEQISLCVDTAERKYSPSGIAEQLSDLAFVNRGYNLLILGASDAGKSYFAKALAIAACHDYKGLYCHCSEIAEKLSAARDSDYRGYEKRMKSLSRLDFLVIDDFLISPLSDSESSIIFRLLESRSEQSKSTIICSQRDPRGWPEMLSGDQVVADAITKRATKNYVVLITKAEN